MFILTAMFVAAGCANATKAKLQQADVSVYSALVAIDKAENDLFVSQALCGTVPCVSAEAHKKFSGQFVIALRAGKTFHLAVAAWKPGQPVPADVSQVALALKSAGETIKAAIPDGPQKDQIGLLIDAGTFAVNQALLLMLPPQEVK